MPRDHFIPAALLGQFSAETTGPLRARRVAVQRSNGAPSMTRAENVGFVNDLYAMSSGDSPSSVDSTWNIVEQEMPAATRLLESGVAVPAKVWLQTLVPYVAMLFVRGKEFDERFIRRMLGDRLPEPGSVAQEIVASRSNVNMARMFELNRLLAPVACANWFVMHSPHGHEGIVNDLGLAATGDLSTGAVGWVVPLSHRVSLGVFPQKYRDVLLYSHGKWMALVQHRYPDTTMMRNLDRALAGAAKDFVVGPTQRAVAGLGPLVQGQADERLLLERWPLSGRQMREYELHWQRLVSLLDTDPRHVPDGEIPPPPGLAGPMGSWGPPIFVVPDEGHEQRGVVKRGNVVSLELERGSSFRRRSS